MLEFPEWRPRRPAVRFVPAFSLLAAQPPPFRFEVSIRVAEAWSPWVATATLGDAAFTRLPEASATLAAEIDELVAAAPADAVRVRLRLRATDGLLLAAAPWLLSLSAWDGTRGAEPTGAGEPVRLAVPPRSQMEEAPAIRMRICSPTCVAMVLEHHGRRVSTASLAAEVFHAGVDRYGVWPAAIRAAGRHGILGYVLRFPDWSAAAWCLAAGLPVIASVRYAADELTGAAIAGTSGHLLVLTGVAGEQVLVNDPAARSAVTVSRSYARAELCSVWLDRGGIGYVLFAAPGPGP